MARYALAAGSKETPPFIRMAAVRPAVVVSPLAAQHFLNFVPLPHGHGSFRPTVIFHSFGRTIRHSRPLASDLPTEAFNGGCLERLVRRDPRLINQGQISGQPFHELAVTAGLATALQNYNHGGHGLHG